MLWFILILFVFGIIFGAIARAIVPGRQKLSIIGTWFLGVVGSFVGGFLGYLLFGINIEDGAIQAAGVIGSIIGSIVTLLVYNAVTGRKRGVLR